MPNLSQIFLAISSLCVLSDAVASDFSLPFFNSAGLGLVYADWATATNDASTAYSNPAGLPQIGHKQLVVNALGIVGSSQFTGSAKTPSFPFPVTIEQSGTSNSPLGAFMPSIYFAAPITDKAALGFNITTPFGLGTKYDNHAHTRYAATRSQVVGIDMGPSLGFKINDYFSIGGGFDALNLTFTLANMYGPPLSFFEDSGLENRASGWGYGGHAGVLFNLPTRTKVGVSYYSRIAVDTKGFSTVYLPSGAQVATHLQKADSALPARAQFSVQQELFERWTAMATAFFANWKTFNQLTMQNTETPMGQLVAATIPFNYHNCWDYSVGATYKATEKFLLRAGIEFMNAPSNDYNRGIADPIGGATILGVGTHYQVSPTLGFDVGVGHSFYKQAPINFSNQLTTLVGYSTTQTTVFGGQVNWNLD